MPSTDFMPGVQRPDLHVFYILDTSGSMRGNPIGVLNNAMESTVDALRQVAAVNSNARVKIAVLEFNTTNRWIQPAGPEEVEYFFWDALSANGMTYMGAALDELDSKLHRGQFLEARTSTLMPIIIFMTDGFANDDYEASLERIMQNKWFKRAGRIGFAIGENPDVSMIVKLTGDPEAVIHTDDLNHFAKMIRFVSTSSVTLGSQSRTETDGANGADVVRDAYDQARRDGVFVDSDSFSNGRVF